LVPAEVTFCWHLAWGLNKPELTQIVVLVHALELPVPVEYRLRILERDWKADDLYKPALVIADKLLHLAFDACYPVGFVEPGTHQYVVAVFNAINGRGLNHPSHVNQRRGCTPVRQQACIQRHARRIQVRQVYDDSQDGRGANGRAIYEDCG